VEGMGDLHGFSPSPIFPNAQTVCLWRCDKNFVYYWLRPDVFPSVRAFYFLRTHP